MAIRHFVGTGTWDASSTANWSATSGGATGASVPTTADNVFIDANSGVVTLGANVVAASVSQAGFTGTLNWAGFKISLAANNSAVFTGVTTCTNTGTPRVELTYSGSVGGRTVNSAAVTEANSISFSVIAGTDTVTLPGVGGAVKSVNFTGFSGALANTTRTVYGSWTNSPTMTATAGASATTFAATSGTQIVTSNSVTLDFPIAVAAVGATVQLADALTMGSTRTFTLTNGTLDLSTFNLTTGVFTSSNTNTRTLATSGGKFILTGNAATVWSTAVVTSLTVTGTLVVDITYSGATGTRTAAFGSLTEANSISYNVTAGTDTFVQTGNPRNVDFTGFAGTLSNNTRTIYGNLTLSATMTATAGTNGTTFAATSGTQVITSNGVTMDFAITVHAHDATVRLADALISGSTRVFSLTAGTIDLQTNTLSSGAINGNNSNTRAIVFGVGSKIVATTSSGTPWNFSTATNFTFTGTSRIECSYSGGTGTRTLSPAPTAGGTEANSPSFYITAGTDIVILTGGSSFGTVDFTGFSGTHTLSNNTFYGNVTFSTGMTITGGSFNHNYKATSGTQVITTNGKIYDCSIIVNAPGATVRPADALTLGNSRDLTLTDGSFDAFNLNVTVGRVSAGALSDTLTLGSGTWTVSGTGGSAFSINAATTVVPSTSTILMTGASAKTFAGAGKTYYNLSQSGAGALSITGANTFNDLQNTVTPATFTLPASTTTTVSALSLQGTAGNLVTLQSSSAGTAATLSKTSGIVNVSYLSIKDSAATGGATFLASTTAGNVDVSGNTGWIFTSGAGVGQNSFTPVLLLG